MPNEIKITVTVTDPAEAEKQLSPIVRKIATDIQAEIIRLMQLPKSGVTFKTRGGRSRQRSAPGEAPAIQTGNLVNSVAQGLTFPTPTTAELSIPPEYAQFLEEGTGRMRPRPFAAPAIKTVTDQLEGSGIIARLS